MAYLINFYSTAGLWYSTVLYFFFLLKIYYVKCWLECCLGSGSPVYMLTFTGTSLGLGLLWYRVFEHPTFGVQTVLKVDYLQFVLLHLCQILANTWFLIFSYLTHCLKCCYTKFSLVFSNLFLKSGAFLYLNTCFSY